MSNQKEVFMSREKDWRNGAIIYQIIVDRFNPSLEIDNKKHLYQYPRVLNDWKEVPKPGTFLKDVKYYSHELDFWGGDLKSSILKIDYLKELNIDCLYLNPICDSLSNHKYDATDYLEISEEYGNHQDLKSLIDILHQNNMKIMLDGVFNHVGINSKLYQKALVDDQYKKFFDFNEKYPEKVRLWADVLSLPELNLENEDVKNYIYKSEDSVIKSYLKQGIDGWRLDVAFDIGYEILSDLTKHAHLANNQSMIVGEIWNYPKKWFKSIDGIMNFTLREIILRGIKGELTSNQMTNYITKMIEDSGIEGMLKSWNLLDNHDVPRLKDLLVERNLQKLAQVMQFTLPGSPNLYYGTELGMDGSGDPMNRAPMRWDLYHHDNEYLVWTKQLINMHKNNRALKIGDYVPILSEKLFAYQRVTDQVKDTIITIFNLNDEEVTESLFVMDSNIMNFTDFHLLLGDKVAAHYVAGLLKVTLKKKSFVVLKPYVEVKKSYTPYKRV